MQIMWDQSGSQNCGSGERKGVEGGSSFPFIWVTIVKEILPLWKLSFALLQFVLSAVLIRSFKGQIKLSYIQQMTTIHWYACSMNNKMTIVKINVWESEHEVKI